MEIQRNILAGDELVDWFRSHSREVIRLLQSVNHSKNSYFFTPIVEVDGKFSFTVFQHLAENKIFVICYEGQNTQQVRTDLESVIHGLRLAVGGRLK